MESFANIDYSIENFSIPSASRSNVNLNSSDDMEAYGHVPGEPLECLSIAIQLNKEEVFDVYGNSVFKVGFKIGGGIDQDPTRAPFLYPDTGIYITHIEANSPADRAGLRQHDKILRVNGNDFTMVTHDRAVRYIKKYPILHILVARSGIPPLNEVMDGRPAILA